MTSQVEPCAELMLDNQLCFKLYAASRAVTRAYKPMLDELGLTYPQYLAMLALWEKETLEVGQLCAMLDLDTGTVSPLLKRLEARGLVQRQRSKDDERVVSVSLTPAAESMLWQSSTGARWTTASVKFIKPLLPPDLRVWLSAT